MLLVVRETPLHIGHLELMAQAAAHRLYSFSRSRRSTADRRRSIDIVNGTVGRILARMGFDNELYYRWEGVRQAREQAEN